MSENHFELETVVISIEDHVAWVRLNRPEVLNAINMTMYADIVRAFEIVNDRADVWLAVLRGTGKAFSVGADLKERQSMSLDDVRRRRRLAPQTFGAIRTSRKPVIGAVHGHAIGGGWELALACDLLIAEKDTRFHLPEVRLGVIPGGGATQLLPRLIGPLRTKELILSGRSISATEALAMGLLNRTAPTGGLENSVRDWLSEFRSSAPIAMQQAKLAIDAARSVPLREGFEVEAMAYERCLATEDRDEGLTAWREKRPPAYKGR